MDLLIADALPERTVAALHERGHACALEPSLTTADLPGRLTGVDVLVVRSTEVDRAALEAADRLALVVRAGAGTNTIDTDAAAELGILVSNVPGRNAAAVAELTMGLLLAVDRRIADNVADLRAGRWEKKEYGRADGLMGKTIGILGLGSIGLGVAQRAAAFGMRVQGVARPGRDAATHARLDDLGIHLCDSLGELLETSDVVSLHVPASSETRQMVDDAFLANMKDDAILLNTSRGDVVDEVALLEALDAGRVRAGLDVYADEPSGGSAAWRSRIAQHPRVVGTHHIGASTEQAQQAIAEGVVEIVDAFAAGEARHCVNLTTSRLGSTTLAIRHLDRVGVLARVLDLLSVQGLNVEQMQNRVFRGGGAAVASIDVTGDLSDALLADLQQVEHVLGVSTAPLAGRE